MLDTSIQTHFIKQWADIKGYRQVDLANELGLEKSTVSRWFSGQIPREKQLIALAGMFDVTVPDLFRDPSYTMTLDKRSELKEAMKEMSKLSDDQVAAIRVMIQSMTTK